MQHGTLTRILLVVSLSICSLPADAAKRKSKKAKAKAESSESASPTGDSETPSIQSCNEAYAVLHDSLYAPVTEVYKDIERKTDWIYHGRLGAIFRGLDPETVHDVFAKVDPKTFENIFYDNLNGSLRRPDGSPITPQEENFLQDLKNFVEDTNGIFWSSKSKEELLANIRKALDEIEQRNTGNAPRLEDIGDHTEKAMETTEEAVLTRGKHDTSWRKKDEPPRPKYPPMYKWAGVTWDPLVRMFYAVYPEVERIVDFTGQIRKRMQHSFLVDRVVIDRALDRTKDLPFEKEDLIALQYLLANTGKQIADAREDIKRVFGKELSYTDPMRPHDVHYYNIAKRAKEYHSVGEYLTDQLAGEKDLDRMHLIIDAARARKNLPPRTPEDYSRDELRFRHMQYKREAGTTAARYQSELGRDSAVDFDVNYTWTVHYTEKKTEHYTVQVKGSDGKMSTQTRTRTKIVRSWTEQMRNTVTRVPEYGHILRNRYDDGPGPTWAEAKTSFVGWVESSVGSATVTARPRLDAIKQATQPLRKSETPFWDFVDSKEDQLRSWVKEHRSLFDIENKKEKIKAFNARTKEVAAAKQELIDWLAKFDKYVAWKKTAVQQQWADDVYPDFQSRNAALAARYRNLIKYYDVYEEQVRRKGKNGPRLIIAYKTPDYSEPLEVMRKRMVRDNWIKGIAATLGGGGIAGGVGYTAWQLSQDPEPQGYEPTIPEEDDFGLSDPELEEFREKNGIELEK